MERGWVKIFRKMEDWEWYQDSKTVHLLIHLLLRANSKDKRFKGHEIKRGQLATGRLKLSEDTGISERSIRTCLKRLVDSKEILIETTSKFSIVTLCNYNEYQKKEKTADQQVTSDRPTSDQQPTSNRPTSDHKQEVKKLRSKEVKKTTKEKNKKEKFSPENFKPDSITEKDWSDLLNHRKAKKAQNTERALSILLKEFMKANITPKECIDEIISRNWTGFKAEWIDNATKRKTGGKADDFDSRDYQAGATKTEDLPAFLRSDNCEDTPENVTS